MKVIFILSLERSGSTFLDLNLSKDQSFLGCGEIFRTLVPHGELETDYLERDCSCGEKVRDCKLWGPYLSNPDNRSHQNLKDAYSSFFNHVKEVYGDNVTLVDSSKSLAALQALKEIGADVNVICLTRDVRGWVQSITDEKERKTEVAWNRIFQKGFRNVWLPYIRHVILRQLPGWKYIEWCLRNYRIRRFLKKSELPVCHLSYDEFVLDWEYPVGKMNGFISERGLSSSMEGGQSHIVRGNRLARKSQHEFSPKYSRKWMYNWKHGLFLSLLFPVFILNKKWVEHSGN